MKTLGNLAAIVFCTSVWLLPSVVEANQVGLVTCSGIYVGGGIECDFCRFVEMVEGILDFITIILILIATIMLAITGIQMAYLAANNQDALGVLKERMLNIVLGFLLIIASWTIIDTLIKLLVSDSSAENQVVINWRNFGDRASEQYCGDMIEPVEESLYVQEDTEAIAPTSVKNVPIGDVTIVLNEAMNPILDPANGGSSKVRPGAAARMRETLNGPFAVLQQNFGRPLVINDAIAKAGTSRETKTPNSRHFFGDAIDVSLAGMTNTEKIRLFREAKAAGFTGFGFGNNILHIDRRDGRSAWAYGNATYGGRSVRNLIAEAKR